MNVQRALFIPLGWRSFVDLIVFQQFDGDVGKRFVGEIAGYMCEVSFRETDFALLDFYCGRLLAFYFVGKCGRSQGNEEIIMVVPMYQSGGMWGDLHFKNSDISILQDLMMRRFGGDFDFLGCRSRHSAYEK